MNKERLKTLADFLENLVENGNKFDMGTWFRENECGTTACALGWATKIPEFKDAGLGVDPVCSWIEYEGLYNANAAMAFFGLDGSETRSLFYATGLANGLESSKSEVVDYIREMISE